MIRVICKYGICYKVANKSLLLKQTRSNFIHTTPVRMKDNFFKTVLNTYAAGVEKVEKVFDKIAPGPMKGYHKFKAGLQQFLGEMKETVELQNKYMASNGELQYNLQQLTLMYQIKRDIRKLFPILMIALLPFALVFIIPITYYFPHIFLTNHFLTADQKAYADNFHFKKQLLHSEFVYNSMHSIVDSIKSKPLYSDIKEVIDQLDKGLQPDIHLITKCSPLFVSQQPFSIEALPPAHTLRLGFIHGIYVDITKNRIRQLGRFIVACDRLILRDKPELSDEQIMQLCRYRGFNTMHVSVDEARQQLNRWLELSPYFTEFNYSLLLHAPILLWYNHPSRKVQSLKIDS